MNLRLLILIMTAALSAMVARAEASPDIVVYGGTSGAAVAAETRANRPNILFIMADDHAAHALSCYGSKINQTPQLDRLAKEGMRFDRCFCVNSICTPSRASILTGKYSHLNGVPVFNKF